MNGEENERNFVMNAIFYYLQNQEGLKHQYEDEMKQNNKKNENVEKKEEKKAKDDLDQTIKVFVRRMKLYCTYICAKHDLSFCSCIIFKEFLEFFVYEMETLNLGDSYLFNKMIELFGRFKDTRISERMKKLGDCLKEILFLKLSESDGIALQLDESTDCSGDSKTIVHVRMKDKNDSVSSMFFSIFDNPCYDTDSYSLLDNLLNELKFKNINIVGKIKSITTDGGKMLKN